MIRPDDDGRRWGLAGPGDLEVRLSLIAILVSIVVYGGMLVLLPLPFPGYDEAKYLSIGLNVLDGNGARTAFGTFFEPHSPLWPVAVAAPARALGVDAYAWAHVLVTVSAGAVIAVGAALGWRVRPAVGALTAVGILAFPTMFGTARGLGLDMTIAALTLAYLWAGLRAVESGSLRWALAAGALFAAAFLVKESVLPLAPVPFVAGLVRERPVREVLRLAAGAVLAAAVGTSWWWLLFAAERGRVYRLGTPAWTLIPIALVVVAFIVVGLRSRPSGAAVEADGAPVEAADAPAEAADAGRRATTSRLPGTTAFRSIGLSPRRLGLVLAVGWIAALTVFFSRTPELLGSGLLDPTQIATNARTWGRRLLPVVILAGGGLAIDLVARLLRRRGPTAAVDDLWLALLCSVPFILLVVGVGEIPRHYYAQIVIALAAGAAGWLWLADRVVLPVRSRPDGRPPAITRAAAIVAVALVLGVGTFLGAATRSTSAGALHDAARTEAVRTIADWVHAELPPGSTIAFASHLSFQAAVQLQADYRTVDVREAQDLVFDPATPLGVRRRDGPAADDWIALATSPGKARAFYGYQAGALADDLRVAGATIWIRAVEDGDGTDPPDIDAALAQAEGVTVRAHWTWPIGDERLRVFVYEIDPDRLAFPPTVWVSEQAAERLVAALESSSSPGIARLATDLMSRLRVPDDTTATAAVRARLGELAGAAGG